MSTSALCPGVTSLLMLGCMLSGPGLAVAMCDTQLSVSVHATAHASASVQPLTRRFNKTVLPNCSTTQ